jgi:hypothetical protein
MVNIIKTWIAKQLFKKGGAIATSKSVDFSTDALIKRLSIVHQLMLTNLS